MPRQSDQDDRSDDHYDYAILMTRFNICADQNEPCDILGLTQVGGMCEWPNSASINEGRCVCLLSCQSYDVISKFVYDTNNYQAR